VASPHFLRQDIWALEEEQTWHPITQAYALGIAAMQARPPEDVTSWAFQSVIHGDPTAPEDDQFRNQCQHNSWFFLPWHRMYLYWFERIVRASIPEAVPAEIRENWALPYWNYSRGGDTRTLPRVFIEPVLPDDETPNPLFVEGRTLNNPLVEIRERLTRLERALRDTVFTRAVEVGRPVGFGGAATGWHHFQEDSIRTPGDLELTPHNGVHGATGGLMGDFDTAGLDPVFWMHHANIDRLWGVWLGLEEGRANPTDPNWLGFEFHFHDEHGAPKMQTPSAVVDTSALDYAYADVAGPVAIKERAGRPPAMAAEPPSHPPELVGATETPLQLTGAPATVALDLTPPTGPARMQFEAQGKPDRVYLNIEGIEGDRNPGLSYAVFVGVGDDADPEEDGHWVGNVSFFGIEKTRDVNDPHAGGLRIAFDITDVVEELRAQGRWDPDRLHVSFTPEVSGPPGGALEAAQALAASPVRIGRVGLYFE
jgi:tyrosinase